MSSELRLKEGELTKYRNVLKGWKKYYFKLERSYLHYFETKYTAKPIGTTTRGEITEVTFSKDDLLFGFNIHLKSGEIWHLQAHSHEDRMDWMKTLKPDAIICDPFKNSSAEQAAPSAPPYPANYHRIYPNLSHGEQGDNMPGSSPPPAYDEIDHR